MFNESTRGHLVRCLENCRQWADDIVIYDDASTDDSVEVAGRYTTHILRGEVNSISNELAHKQLLLDYAITLQPDWIMWVDADEILDRAGTRGGLRQLCERAAPTTQAFSFHQLNLWRSETYARRDTLFDKGWFVRLWRVLPGIRFDVQVGVHLRLYPVTIDRVEQCAIRVIHYGFADYAKTLVKIGADHWTRDDFARLAAGNWILNETECSCYRVPYEWFPVENVRPDSWTEPKPRRIDELVPYSELPANPV